MLYIHPSTRFQSGLGGHSIRCISAATTSTVVTNASEIFGASSDLSGHFRLGQPQTPRKIDFPTSHLQHPCEVQEIILPSLPCDLGSPVEVDSILLSNLGGEPPAPLALVCLLHAPPAVSLLKPFRSWSRIEDPGGN